MQSVQSKTVQTIIKSFRSTLVIAKKLDDKTSRKSFERLSTITKFPRAVEKEETVYEGIEAAWFTPHHYNHDTVLLYLPGGAYCFGSFKTHRALIARIARAAHCKAIGINYAKAPEEPFPKAIEDGIKVYKQLIADGYKNIILGGDSAGGGLALALTLEIMNQQLQMPSNLVLIAPWTDLTMSGDSIKSKADVDPMLPAHLLGFFAEKYYTTHDPTNPLISPLFADFKGFPPTLIQVGTSEVLLDDSIRVANKMKLANVTVELDVWNNMMHVWHYLGGIIPEANQAIEKIGNFIKNNVNHG